MRCGRSVEGEEPEAGSQEPEARQLGEWIVTEPAFQVVVDEPGLPRVLLIGDSISMGYTLPVRELLRGKANVHRPGENCEHTWKGLERLDGWLGTGRWNVIHFNFGLHDVKYVGKDGQNTSPERGRRVSTVAQYEAKLQKIVTRLKQTEATLLWCSTTPVPADVEWRIAGSEREFNDAALRVMRQNAVAVNDLWSVAAERLVEIQRPANVHFTEDGYRVLGQHVAAAIEAALQSRRR